MTARLVIAGFTLVLSIPALAATDPEDTPSRMSVSYNRDIRPLLSDRCFTCHGPDAAARKADLRLDTFEESTKARKHGAAIVPGDVARSELWQRITTADPDDRMPPDESEKHQLNAVERKKIHDWISAGAHYEKHWSFIPPQKVQLDGRLSSVIDTLIERRLIEAGIAANPRADRDAQVRRLFLDITGLPPTTSELDAFAADVAPDAYERLVEQLLTQEPYVSRYAERMTGPWLDQARYADTSGIHMDAGRSIWPWRDWVLNAFRTNMPFDRFIVEQLAGDLIPNATIEQKIATGFNRNHVTSDEGGAISEEYLVEYAVDRVNTTASVFLGMTVGCARCHDHKYDPISMEEFYSLFAYFNSVEEPGIYSQLPDAQRALEPFIEVASTEQTSLLEQLNAKLAEINSRLNAEDPADGHAMSAYFLDAPGNAGIHWTTPEVIQANSSGGSTLSILEDRSVLASGANPDTDTYTLTLRGTEQLQRLVMLEVLTHETIPNDRPGRAGNGNAMLTGISCTIAPESDPSATRPVHFQWAWADVEQTNGDYRINALWHPGSDKGWALNGHMVQGRRTAILLANEPFTMNEHILSVTLEFRSPYQRHAFGRVRIRTSAVTDSGLETLPSTVGAWHVAGPFEGSGAELFAQSFGPEESGAFDFARVFTGNRLWSVDASIIDGQVRSLSGGTNVTYLAQRVYAPTPRSIDTLVGSDDAIRIFVNGEEQFANNTARSARADQDRATLRLRAGANDVVYKVINTGGDGGFAGRLDSETGRLSHALVSALMPSDSISDTTANAAKRHWRYAYSPAYRSNLDARNAAEKHKAEVVAAIPRTMVMKESATPRETFLLTRGQYDHPDKSKPAKRNIPKSFGTLPADTLPNRLGLANWIVSSDNPLTSRVLVNRVWGMFFGTGLVATDEDFGLQGNYPTHPELLDHLAIMFQESGWNLRELVREIVLSDTYRRSAFKEKLAAEIDPENQLLARFPRRRMSAEQIRDAALHSSGLLHEKLGGPPVKPIQPTGLWEETSMLSSNTRTYATSAGDDLHRRSLYTYWKRASPPPNMSVFDAPTRETCVTQRINTNTPLQALVLWNDPQFVEAARALAQSVLSRVSNDDERINAIYRALANERPDESRLAALRELLAAFRLRYQANSDDARKLLSFAGMMESESPSELASWTMISCTVMSTDSFITKD